MDNFQLYRTNVMLGGQMKWDLVLDSIGSELIIKDFHLSPISKLVPFNKYSQEYLLRFSHQENVKKYYNNISGSFYENYIDQQLESSWPILADAHMDTHVGDFEMGSRRALYKIYNKQFEFFCPLWIEKLNDILKLELEVCSGVGNIICKKYLLFDFQQNITTPEQKFHNTFIHYFNNFINYMGLDRGNDNIMNINLKNNYASVGGLNVKTGLNSTIIIPNIVNNLISRERPLLEFDNIIISQLKDNKFITPQLFNLNICFNPDDILSPYFSNMLLGKQIGFRLHAYIGDKKLKLKDFYSNFEYIPRKNVGPVNMKQSSTAPNVLDYLQDYKFIDLIDKNKMVQSNIHWSLVGNNDYIFNIYEGFKGYSIDENGNIVNHTHLYDNSPDISHAIYKQYFNSVGWCNLIKLDNETGNDKITESNFWNNVDVYTKFASDFSNNKEWVNKIKYGTFDEDNKLNILLIENNTDNLLDITKFDVNTSIHCINLKVIKNKNDQYTVTYKDLTNNIINDGKKQDSNETETISFYDDFESNLQIILYNDNTLIFIIRKGNEYKDFLTFPNMYSIINNLMSSEDDNSLKWMEGKHVFYKPLFDMCRKMKSADNTNNPPIIIPKSSLIITKAKGPSASISEITYHKSSEPGEYMLRYSGRIKPTFISGENDDINFNYMYYRDFMSPDKYKNSKYGLYINTKFQPLFPSIDYFSIKKMRQNYNELPITYKDTKMLNSYEYHWFNNNLNVILKDEINVNLHSCIENSNYVKLKILIKDYLKQFYHIDDDQYIDYIYGLYDIESSYDYAAIDNIIDYIYTVKLKLK